MNNIYSSDQIQIVNSFEELISKPFQGKVNAIGWIRQSDANFKEIVDQLKLFEDITEITIEDLNALNLSSHGINARNIIIQDFNDFSNTGHSPSLNLLKKYPTDNEFDFISTDVYSFHVDRSPEPTDTILCTYYGASSDIIANENAIKKIEIPEVREKLFQLYDDISITFEEFLVDNYFDMHYECLSKEEIINLGNVHIWRLAVDHPYLEVRPSIHRAPRENPNELRLLLIC